MPDLNIIIGLGFLGLFCWLLYSNFKTKASVVPTDPASPATNDLLASFGKLGNTFNVIEKTSPNPSREEAFKAAFTLIDYAKSIDAKDTVKAVSDQLPNLIGGK